MDCANCEYMDTNCFIRYWKDIQEFGVTEWICPVCGKSHIKKMLILFVIIAGLFMNVNYKEVKYGNKKRICI